MLKLALILVASIFLAGAACDPVRPDPGNPLAVAECPAKLPGVVDDSFGETAKKAVEWANTYHRCRRAALGDPKTTKKE